MRHVLETRSSGGTAGRYCYDHSVLRLSPGHILGHSEANVLHAR
jgi:hypothetical protein